MKRLFVVLGLLAGLMLMPVAAQASSLQLDWNDIAGSQCKTDTAKKIVDVTYRLVNDYDSGFAGNAWANDTIDRHLRIWKLNGGTSYCAQVEDRGTFVTFAGTSPSGSSTVPAGVTGDVRGGYVSTFFTGTANPSPLYAKSGDLGTYDLHCTDANNCPGPHPTPQSYFTTTSGFDLAQWGWIYHTNANGTWLNQDDTPAASSGDIKTAGAGGGGGGGGGEL